MQDTTTDPSRADRLAMFFQTHPNTWIDGMTLSGIAGQYAWRSRVSDLRRPPYNLTVVNRQRRVRRDDARESSFVVSEYRLVSTTGEDRGSAAQDVRASHAAV